MTTTADAIMGQWDGFGTHPSKAPDAWEQFAQLDPVWQMTVLEQDLAPLLQVKPRQADPKQPDQELKNGFWLGVYSQELEANILEIKSPSWAIFNTQLPAVRSHADLRGERAGEIADQLADVLPYFAMIAALDGERHRWTVLLLSLIQRVTSRVVQRMKLYYQCPRPAQYSKKVLPIIGTPTHGTFPSCHAGLVFCLATTLESLSSPSATPNTELTTPVTKHAGNTDEMLKYVYEARAFRLAERIAENRVVAGVHFPIDNQMGALIGTCIAEYLLTSFAESSEDKEGNGTDIHTWEIDATNHCQDKPFRLQEFVETFKKDARPPLNIPKGKSMSSSLVKDLYTKARTEWQYNGIG